MAVNPTPAYQTYNRLPLPNGVTDDAPNDLPGLVSYTGDMADAQTNLLHWLGTEMLTVQRAIPLRVTKTVTAAYTLLTTDDVVLVDCTTGAITITWPDPTRSQHFTATVKKIDATANAVTFASIIASTGVAATFDGVASPTLATQYKTKIVRSDGIQYYVLASF